MKLALVTGSAGLVGAETVRFLCEKKFDVVGIDNNLREYFFGDAASTEWARRELESSLPSYRHVQADIRDTQTLESIFAELGNSLELIVHAAGQPSHEWATHDPRTDFDVNAAGTLNLLELTRRHAPQASFIFTSSNKVYGDAINRSAFDELPTRWEIAESHPFHARGVDETFSIDQSMHSLFSA
jgi:CDP-paratose 2-epimerase